MIATVRGLAMYKLLTMLTLIAFTPSASAAEVQGHLAWAQRVELSTPVSGKIDRVLVDVGDRVPAGEALLKLDERPFQARVARARAELASAEQVLAEARRELERAQELFDRQVMSTHELQLEEVALSRAEAAFERARSELQLAELDLEYATVRAPFDALVLARQAEPGQTVVTRLQTTPLLVLAHGDRVLARVAVSDAQLQRLQVGQEVTVRLDGGSLRGTIARLGLERQDQAQEGAALYGVDVALPAGEGRILRAGQAVTVVLP